MPSSSMGCETAESCGLVKDSTTGPSKVIMEMSLPIVLFNSLQAWIAPTLEYSVEHIIHFKSGFLLIKSKVIPLEKEGSSRLVVLYTFLSNLIEYF